MTMSTRYHHSNLARSNSIQSIITYCSKVRSNIVFLSLSLDCPIGLILLKCYKLAYRNVIFYGFFNNLNRCYSVKHHWLYRQYRIDLPFIYQNITLYQTRFGLCSVILREIFMSK
jgi:hypothetical protein